MCFVILLYFRQNTATMAVDQARFLLVSDEEIFGNKWKRNKKNAKKHRSSNENMDGSMGRMV